MAPAYEARGGSLREKMGDEGFVPTESREHLPRGDRLENAWKLLSISTSVRFYARRPAGQAVVTM